MALFSKKPKTSDAPAEDAEAKDAAAPGEDGAEGEAGPAKKKGPPLKLVIIGAAAGLLLVGGGGAAFMVLMPHPKADKADAHHKDRSKKKADDAKGPVDKSLPQVTDGPNGVIFYTLPDMVVNMQTGDGKPTYLKLKLTLELPSEDTVDVIEPNRLRLQDMFQTFLRELRPEDLAGSQGSYELRMEILRRVNLIIAPEKINAVLIEEMLIS